MRHVLILCALSLTGCDLAATDLPTTDTDGTTDTEPTVGCPAGMAKPKAVNVSLSAVIVNSLSVGPTFDENAVYDGKNAACVSKDGMSMRLLLYAYGEPFAWWTSTSTKTGTLTLGGDGEIVFDAFGHDPATTFDGPTWTAGIWNISGTKPVMTHTLNAQAAGNGQFLVAQVTAEVTP